MTDKTKQEVWAYIGKAQINYPCHETLEVLINFTLALERQRAIEIVEELWHNMTINGYDAFAGTVDKDGKFIENPFLKNLKRKLSGDEE